jgi:gas vesicle protein
MEREEGSESGLWYLIAGAAIGTVLGVLIAPKKGSETREDIGDWLRDGREKNATMTSTLGAIVPLKVKAAAALGAMKAGGTEALREVAEHLNLDGTDR